MSTNGLNVRKHDVTNTAVFTSHWSGLKISTRQRDKMEERVTADKGVPQDQNGACGSVLMGRSGATAEAVNMLDLLLVPEQDKDHGATGPDHEAQTHKVK